MASESKKSVKKDKKSVSKKPKKASLSVIVKAFKYKATKPKTLNLDKLSNWTYVSLELYALPLEEIVYLYYYVFNNGGSDYTLKRIAGRFKTLHNELLGGRLDELCKRRRKSDRTETDSISR